MKTILECRINLLKTVLTWEGSVDNQRIRELFNVGSVWASRLLAKLQTDLGKNVVRTSSYAPLTVASSVATILQKSTLDDYLAAIGNSTKTDSLKAVFDEQRIDYVKVSPAIFSVVRTAIRSNQGIKIVYCTMTDPMGRERLVFPHVVFRTTHAWLVRGWCEDTRCFRDFNLGRISTALATPSLLSVDHEMDDGWNKLQKISIVAHPSLSLEQQGMVSAMYFPNASARSITVRHCRIRSIIRDLHIATDVTKHPPPEHELFIYDFDKIVNESINWD